MPFGLPEPLRPPVLFLALLSGAAWSCVYARAIVIGVKGKTCTFPLFALALNVAWEGQYCYLGFTQGPEILQWMPPELLAQAWVDAAWRVHAWVNLLWLLLDCAIVWTHFRFGRGEHGRSAGPKTFVARSVAAFAAAILLQATAYLVFGSFGCAYAAFTQNLVMSLLFIDMLRRRQGPRGQSLDIAVCKCVGTLAPTVGFTLVLGNRLILTLGALCAAADVLYIVRLRKAIKAR